MAEIVHVLPAIHLLMESTPLVQVGHVASLPVTTLSKIPWQLALPLELGLGK